MYSIPFDVHDGDLTLFMEVQTAMIDITIECSTIEHSNRTTLHRVYYFGRYSAVIEFRIQSNHSSRQCNAQCSWNPEPFTYVIKPYSIVGYGPVWCPAWEGRPRLEGANSAHTSMPSGIEGCTTVSFILSILIELLAWTTLSLCRKLRRLLACWPL